MKIGAGVRVSFVLMLTGATGASLPGDAFGQGQIVFTTDRDHPNGHARRSTS